MIPEHSEWHLHEFTTTFTISAYHCEFEPHSWCGVLDTTYKCDRVCQWLATGLWCTLSTLVSSTNKTDRQNITEIMLKVALSTITPPLEWHLWNQTWTNFVWS